MAASLTGSLKLTVTGELTNTEGLVTARASLSRIITKTLTTTNVSDVYTNVVTSSGAGATTYDLIGGASLDPLGQAVDMDSVSMIVLDNTGSVAITLSGLDTDICTGNVRIPAGGCFVWCVPAGITNTVELIITPASAGAAWELIVMGKPA